MLENYSGATRVIFIVGDPIAQVKSPLGVTRVLRERGYDAIVVPAHVRPADLADFVSIATRMPNVDGIIATVPHKFALAGLCAQLSPTARSIGAANIARRLPGGGWFGDMSDGHAYTHGLNLLGLDVRGRRTLLVGAGGAGSAIAHALVDGGVAALALHDCDTGRRDALAARITAYCAVSADGATRDDGVHGAGTFAPRVGSADPTGFDLVINATPMGMQPSDPLPVDASRLSPDTFVGDVITAPEVPPLLRQARERGCRTMTGVQMFDAVSTRIVDFYMGTP